MVSRPQEAFTQPAEMGLHPIIPSAIIEEMLNLELPSYEAIMDGREVKTWSCRHPTTLPFLLPISILYRDRCQNKSKIIYVT